MAYKPLVIIKNLTISYLDKTLFEKLSFGVGRGEIIALVGANGCGKTTLLDFIRDKITAPEDFLERHELQIKGELVAAGGLAIGYLPQRLMDDFLSGRTTINAGLLEQLRASFELEDIENEKVKLSDGQRQKRAIVKVMAANADCLLFDEPTNYLDIAGITAFEDSLELLKSRGRGIVLVSHDRTLINNLADRTIYFTPNGIFQTEGGYSEAWSLAESEYEARAKKAGIIGDKIARLQSEMRQRMGWAAEKEKSKIGAGKEKPHIAKISAKMAARAKAAQSKAEKEQEKLQKTKPFVPKKLALHFPDYTVRHRDVFSLQNVTFSYPVNFELPRPPLLEDITIAASTRDKFCLMGANGAGKTTLFKIILREYKPQKGSCRSSDSANIKLLPQGLAGFFDRPTLLDNFTDTGCDETTVRRQLGSVLLRGDKVTEPVGNFSQGELMRAAIVKCILLKAEFLLLDEPTSHLDIESVQVLERMLDGFPGGFLIISHDRSFVENIADRLYMLEAGRLRLV
ncbi:MAG: ABC-F family ATP-binding cassette domain-containing protein [candidate division Zixibacteria bacterium]|nr:ABC-F family ATP-binding cassette domain-containing protein [candidate division Zixibacteria bacterium]